MFIDRKKELRALNQMYASNKFNFLILYGRRIGETCLLTEFYKNKEGIFYLAEEQNDALNIASFCQKIYSKCRKLLYLS